MMRVPPDCSENAVSAHIATTEHECSGNGRSGLS